jgi:hypothetical protein
MFHVTRRRDRRPRQSYAAPLSTVSRQDPERRDLTLSDTETKRGKGDQALAPTFA